MASFCGAWQTYNAIYSPLWYQTTVSPPQTCASSAHCWQATSTCYKLNATDSHFLSRFPFPRMPYSWLHTVGNFLNWFFKCICGGSDFLWPGSSLYFSVQWYIPLHGCASLLLATYCRASVFFWFSQLHRLINVNGQMLVWAYAGRYSLVCKALTIIL